MSLRTLFVVACVSNLNACPDWIWCCGNREVSVDLECEIEDLDDLKLSLEHKLSKYQNGDWVVPLSNGKNISGDSSNPPKVSCSLDPGIIETDGIRFEVKDKDGNRTVSWIEIMYDNLTDEQLDQLKDMPKNCDYIIGDSLFLREFFTEFLLGVENLLHNKKAILDRDARRIYGWKYGLALLFIWQDDQKKWHNMRFDRKTKKFVPVTDLLQEWECDINDSEELKTILEGKTEAKLTEREDGSWYADLEHYFIFVNSNGKCYCRLSQSCIIYGIKFTVEPAAGNKSHKKITWGKFEPEPVDLNPEQRSDERSQTSTTRHLRPTVECTQS